MWRLVFFIQTLCVFFFYKFSFTEFEWGKLWKWDKHILNNFWERKSLKLQENIKSIRKIAVMVDWNAKKNTVEKLKCLTWINLGDLHKGSHICCVLQKW